MGSTSTSAGLSRARRGLAVALVACAGTVPSIAAAVDLDDFRLALRAETGQWDGECTSLSAEGPERYASAFRIDWDAERGHVFTGSYGRRTVRGSSRLVGAYLEERLAGETFGHLVRIDAVRYDGPEDYSYVTVDELARPPKRVTVTRRGATQTRVVTTDDGARTALQRCEFERSS